MASHDDSSASLVRLNAERRHNNATTMTTRSTTSVRPLRPVQKNTSWSITPRARPAPKAAPTESMPVMVAAARPRIRSGRPTASVDEKPMTGARSMPPAADSSAASTHAMVDTRRTIIPGYLLERRPGAIRPELQPGIPPGTKPEVRR